MMCFDFVVFLILMKTEIKLYTLFIKRKRVTVQTVQIVFGSKDHVALFIQNWLLRPLVMLEHQIFESFCVVGAFTRQVFEYSH